MVRNWNRDLFFSLIWIAVTILSVYPEKTRKEYNNIIFCFLTRYWYWINACFCVLSVRSKIRSWNALSGHPFNYEESSWKSFFISLIINQCFSGIAERNDSRIFNLTKFLDEISNLRFSFIRQYFLASQRSTKQISAISFKLKVAPDPNHRPCTQKRWLRALKTT